jgi:GalNAc-alpha-(1->4)-GalNAc-alpha-(1->3)-diNAcBac-PP-undecaprenol alpha-1,4-N-acetyl-D-galactosaminyltransferase
MKTALRICFVIPTLGAGGAERVASILCGEWAKLGCDVHVLTYQAHGEHSHYPMASGITVHQLDMMRSTDGGLDFVLENLLRLWRLRRHLRLLAPDVVVAFMPEPNVVTRLATLGMRAVVVLSERVHPAYLPHRRLLLAMQRRFYPLADAVVVQTSVIAEYVMRHFGVRRASVIPNPLDIRTFRTFSSDAHASRGVLAVGRLDVQKGFDCLIKAFSILAADFPDWILTILGEGPQRKDLEVLIAECGLQGRVVLPGVISNVAECLQSAALFVHAARFEGYPNAVMEALAAGCPVVATDSPGGARELLENGRYGLLVDVDDVVGLSQAMGELMASPQRRQALSETAPAAVQHLDAGRIAGRWIALFEELHAAARIVTP